MAEEFWTLSNVRGKWPRDIVRAISILLPLRLITLPELDFEKVKVWLSERNVPFENHYGKRGLHGLILVHRGAGFIFINGTDNENERRFTVTHEACHYIVDYKLPRDKAHNKFGASIDSVLDGDRSPTDSERLNSILTSTPISGFLHILEKTGQSKNTYSIWSAENRADHLALELLAPAKMIMSDSRIAHLAQQSFLQRKLAIKVILEEEFLLPETVSEDYASRLAASRKTSLIEKLRITRS